MLPLKQCASFNTALNCMYVLNSLSKSNCVELAEAQNNNAGATMCTFVRFKIHCMLL